MKLNVNAEWKQEDIGDLDRETQSWTKVYETIIETLEY